MSARRSRGSVQPNPLRPSVVTAVLCLAVAAALPAFSQPITFHKVADVFTPIPGRPGETFAEAGGDDCDAFSDAVEAPAVDAGEVVFWATSEADSSYEGVFSWQAGTTTVVADFDTTAPGEAMELTDLTWAPTVRQGAHGVWGLSGPSSSEAVYHEQGGGLTRVAGIGDPAPGGSTFDDFGESPSAELGGLAFYAETDDGGSGIYYWDGSSIVTVADESTEAPGQPGVTFDGFEETGTTLVEGRVVFLAQTVTDLGGGAFSTHQGIYLWDGGSLTVVADESTEPPGSDDPFADLGDSEALAPAFDGTSVVFFGRIEIPVPGGASFFDGIYRWQGGAIAPIVTSDSPRPDGGGTFGGGFEQFAVSGDRVVFGHDCYELFLAEDGTVTRLLGELDLLDGRPVESAWVGRMGIDPGGVALNVYFGDDDEPNAVYYAAFPVAAPPISEVPTLGEWGLIALALLLAAAATLMLRPA